MNNDVKKNTELDKILDDTSFEAPSDNAQKTAINMAMMEFKSYQNEKNEKTSQGFLGWLRHMGTTFFNDRRDPMNKKFIYGGMATAMVVILASGVAVYQTENNPLVTGVPHDGTAVLVAPADIPVAEIERDIEPPSAYTAEESIEQAAKVDDSFIPAPTTPQRQKEVSGNVANLTESFAPPALHSQSRSADIAQLSIAPPIPVPSEPGNTYYQDEGRDKFEAHEISPVKIVKQEPVSTFSVDVDTASYSFVRRQLNHGVLPNADAVRIEELINYFPYAYEGPESKDTPFKANVAVLDSPWTEGNKLIHIGIKGYDLEKDVQPRANLVFLLDVSGSMNAPDKLPLLKNSFKLLLNTLQPEDMVSIVTYAGRAGTALEPTKVSDKDKILAALENLNAGGGTAGAAGIQGAYALAEQNFDEEGVNRVILATDGDFNIGMSSTEDMKKLIEEKRDSGIFLSVFGFGQGNLNDHLMQTLAQNGNGVAAHIDTLNEAQKVLVDEANSTLFPIAKDVKIQIEFNPATVQEYRLVGYETRALAREDFNNDKVDAGDIGAGHTVTAIYEITPVGSGNALNDPSRYEEAEETTADTDFSDEYAFLKMRYKLPNEDTSTLVTTPITKQDQKLNECPPCPQQTPPVVCSPCASDAIATNDQLFSIAVAGFGQLLKNDKYAGDLTYDDVIDMAQKSKGDDTFGYRAEFINLVRLAKSLQQ
jgi:Ca-activated chloride channel homolog